MKICLISFDYWGYDEKIVDELNAMKHDAQHIKLSLFHYKYPNFKAKLTNFFSKIILRKNIKKNKTEEFILSQINEKGYFDKIIVINPERISKKCHLLIKKNTSCYIAYLYDSIDRYNTKDLIYGHVFDEIFSFDKKDAIRYNLKFLPNYIHFKKKENKPITPINKIFSISSIDERYSIIDKFIAYFNEHSITHETIFFDKKIPRRKIKSATYTKVKLNQEQIQEKIENSEIVLDILRKNQTGISFRIFDALAFEKKIITTNKSVRDFDFYNPNNILIVDSKDINIPNDFLNSAYIKLPDYILNKYSLENWIKTIFNIEK